jgi:hypothetical protein
MGQLGDGDVVMCWNLTQILPIDFDKNDKNGYNLIQSNTIKLILGRKWDKIVDRQNLLGCAPQTGELVKIAIGPLSLWWKYLYYG